MTIARRSSSWRAIQHADADVSAARAVCFRALGDEAAARQWAKAALDQQPRHYRALQVLALLQLDAGRYESALKLVGQLRGRQQAPPARGRRLAQLNPEAFPVYDTQAQGETLYLHVAVLQRMGREEEAEQQRDRLMVLQEAAAQIKELSRLAFENPTNVELLHKLGSLYSQINFREDARIWFERALQADPAHTPSRNALRQLRSQPPPRQFARP